MYLKFQRGIVCEIIPDEAPGLPGIPIEKRYPAAYIASLTYVPDDTIVGIGWGLVDGVYVPVTEDSAELPGEIPTPEPTLRERIIALEAEKAALAAQLASQDMVLETILEEILPTLAT